MNIGLNDIEREIMTLVIKKKRIEMQIGIYEEQIKDLRSELADKDFRIKALREGGD